MNYQEALDKLFSLHQFGIKLGLENIQNLLTHIGNPQKKLRTIHIAGSNGKGSTSSFIASILKEANYKVGLYTSPHFVEFNERIRINGITISNNYIVNFINNNIDYINNESPTFFELTTALAFQYFADENVDYAIIETGLGGRLDATNVLNSFASVITSISLEHTNILGSNLTAIAREKAGIVKKNQKVFIGLIPDEAKEQIGKICNDQSSELIDISNFLEIKKSFAEIRINNEMIQIKNLPLRGEFQLHNASLSSIVISELFSNITKDEITNGLENVIKNSGIEGRYEVYSNNPKVIFDAAHNLEGINVFLKEFDIESIHHMKKSVIFGSMKDKNVEKIIIRLSKSFDEIFATEIDYERSLSISEIVGIGEKIGVKIFPMERPHRFINNFISTVSNASLVILGSIYILGEIKKRLQTNNN